MFSIVVSELWYSIMSILWQQSFFCKQLVTSGARSAERVLWFKGEISVCAARPDPTQPDPVTLLRILYLWNGLTDSRAVFFVLCHHSINFVFDRHRYLLVPVTARGTWRGEGVGDTLSIGNFTTAGPIAFIFGVCLLAITSTQVRGGVNLHVRTCTPVFHISKTAGRIAFKFCVWLGTH